MGSFLDGIIAGSSLSTARNTKRANLLLAAQLHESRAVADRDHRYKYDTDAEYRAWCDEEFAREAAAIKSRTNRDRTTWWVLGMIVVPFVLMWLPTTHRRIQWPWFLRWPVLVVWSAFILTMYVIS